MQVLVGSGRGTMRAHAPVLVRSVWKVSVVDVPDYRCHLDIGRLAQELGIEFVDILVASPLDTAPVGQKFCDRRG